MPQFQPLYKPDTKGNPCIWSIAVNDDSYTISHGKVGGKIQNKTTICAPKNVGRSNESTGREQALKEAEAKWIERKDRKGYGLTVEEATDCEKPMLSHGLSQSRSPYFFPLPRSTQIGRCARLHKKSK